MKIMLIRLFGLLLLSLGIGYSGLVLLYIRGILIRAKLFRTKGYLTPTL